MMNINDFNKAFTDPHTQVDLFALRQMVANFPYFEMARLVYLRELKKRDNNLFVEELGQSAIHFSDRKFAYLFINEAESKSSVAHLYDAGMVSSDYFALENSGVSKDSLRELAKRLRRARLERIANVQENPPSDELGVEDRVKNLILEQRYFEALKLLKKINLNNSEKSVYFAFQIKYLETILNSEG